MGAEQSNDDAASRHSVTAALRTNVSELEQQRHHQYMLQRARDTTDRLHEMQRKFDDMERKAAAAKEKFANATRTPASRSHR